ncbi:MAG: glutathione S-transferase [Polyangiales bacterium]|nr:glutathione S-transferase [Myxococcales bacterium]MCA9576553.1 glutathione S-transferase [Myxococcales bacterium]
MTITVHHLNYSRSLRVLWMLEELGLHYEVREWQRDANFRAPSEARTVHPLGRFPMVEVDGVVLAESGAILEFFAEREGKLGPVSEAEKLEYRFFMHYAEGSLMPPLLVQLILNKLRAAPMPFFVKPVARGIASKLEGSYSGPALALHLGFVEQTLGGRRYFAGDHFTMADLQMFYPVEAGLSRGEGSFPHMRAWRDRVCARDAYARAEARGGTAVPTDL